MWRVGLEDLELFKGTFDGAEKHYVMLQITFAGEKL